MKRKAAAVGLKRKDKFERNGYSNDTDNIR